MRSAPCLAILWLLVTCSVQAIEPAPTPTATPCDSSGAQLVLEVTADVAMPVVGDVVHVNVAVSNPSGGLAGLPSYSLVGADPIFTVELIDSGYPLASFSRYRLTAVQAGRAELRASVYYETSRSCFGGPVFFFRSSSSDLFTIEVRGAGATTPTPTPTPMQPSPTVTLTSNRPIPIGVVRVTPNPARSGQRVELDSHDSYGAINQRYWSQLDGPAVELQGCTVYDGRGCLGATAWFTAPPVRRATIVRVNLLLTSYGSTSWTNTAAEITILPFCAGDCSGDLRVTIDELIAAVTIALDGAALSTCLAADGDGSATVTIDDLITALGSALDGCP